MFDYYKRLERVMLGVMCGGAMVVRTMCIFSVCDILAIFYGYFMDICWSIL